jgi:hypothetical protein
MDKNYQLPKLLRDRHIGTGLLKSAQKHGQPQGPQPPRTPPSAPQARPVPPSFDEDDEEEFAGPLSIPLRGPGTAISVPNRFMPKSEQAKPVQPPPKTPVQQVSPFQAKQGQRSIPASPLRPANNPFAREEQKKSAPKAQSVKIGKSAKPTKGLTQRLGDVQKQAQSAAMQVYNTRRWLFWFTLIGATLSIAGALFVLYHYSRPYLPFIVKWVLIALGAAFALALLTGLLWIFAHAKRAWREAHKPHIITHNDKLYVLDKKGQPKQMYAVDEQPQAPQVRARVIDALPERAQSRQQQRSVPLPVPTQKPVQQNVEPERKKTNFFTTEKFAALPSPRQKAEQAKREHTGMLQAKVEEQRAQTGRIGAPRQVRDKEDDLPISSVIPEIAVEAQSVKDEQHAPSVSSVRKTSVAQSVPEDEEGDDVEVYDEEGDDEPEELISPKGEKAPKGLPPQAPKFGDINLLQYITKGMMILGYTFGGPIVGTIEDLYSCNIIGMPGRGKSVFLRFLIAQFMLLGAKVWVFDSHATMTKLKKLFVYEHDIERMSKMVPRLKQELDDRKRHFDENEGVCLDEPFLLIIDELPTIAAWEEEMREEKQKFISIIRFMRRLVLEGRKFNMFLILAGQGTPATVLPTLTRDNLSSKFVFFTSNGMAKMGGLEKDHIHELLPLLAEVKNGYCVARIMSRPYADIISIPETYVADLAELQTLYPDRVKGVGDHELVQVSAGKNSPGKSPNSDVDEDEYDRAAKKVPFPEVPFPQKESQIYQKVEHKTSGNGTSGKDQGPAFEAEGRRGMAVENGGRLGMASGAEGRQVVIVRQQSQQFGNGRELPAEPRDGRFVEIEGCGKVPVEILVEIERLARSGKFARKEIVRALPEGYRSNGMYAAVKVVCDKHGLLMGNINQYSQGK